MFLLDLDPNIVKPGWTPLVITVILGAVLVLLYLSMKRQVRRISVPYRGEESTPSRPEPTTSPETPVEPETTISQPENTTKSG